VPPPYPPRDFLSFSLSGCVTNEDSPLKTPAQRKEAGLAEVARQRGVPVSQLKAPKVPTPQTIKLDPSHLGAYPPLTPGGIFPSLPHFGGSMTNEDSPQTVKAKHEHQANQATFRAIGAQQRADVTVAAAKVRNSSASPCSYQPLANRGNLKKSQPNAGKFRLSKLSLEGI
jgi:hypothetical protein